MSLAANFVSERRSENDANIEEFKAWLADQRHDDIIKLLESNTATTVGIKALLHESRSDIISHLEQLALQITSRSDQSERAPAQETADVIETIYLGINNAFVGGAGDMADLATRCAIYAIHGKRVKFQVELQETVLDTPLGDPLILPRYEKARLERARQLESRLELLTSQAVHDWWQYFLGRAEDWGFAIQSLLLRASLDSNNHAVGQKIDVWRTEEPTLSAAIYLNAQDVTATLEHLGFQSTRDLRMGAHWRAALDLPLDLIARHVIPNIIVQLERQGIPAVGEVLNLAAWHIGEG